MCCKENHVNAAVEWTRHFRPLSAAPGTRTCVKDRLCVNSVANCPDFTHRSCLKKAYVTQRLCLNSGVSSSEARLSHLEGVLLSRDEDCNKWILLAQSITGFIDDAIQCLNISLNSTLLTLLQKPRAIETFSSCPISALLLGNNNKAGTSWWHRSPKSCVDQTFSFRFGLQALGGSRRRGSSWAGETVSSEGCNPWIQTKFHTIAY